MRIFKIVAVISALIALIVLIDDIVRAFGAGTPVLFFWLGAIAWLTWAGRYRRQVRWWHRWVGAALLTIAWLGLMGLSHPGIAMGSVSLADVSAGGRVGAGLAHAPFGGLRIAILIIAGLVFIAPHRSRELFGGLGDWIGSRIHRLRTNPPTLPRRRPPSPGLGAKRVAPEGEIAPPAIGIEREPAPTRIEAVREKPLIPIPELPVTPEQQLPPLELIDQAPEIQWSEADSEARSRLIEGALASYGVEAKVVKVNPGPSVTQFGVEPGWDRRYRRVAERDSSGRVRLDHDGSPKVHVEEISKTRVKVERIASLANDLALALAVPSVRIEAPIPGTGLMGIEVPNTGTALVSLREVMESVPFQRLRAKTKLPIALGRGAGGEPVVADLTKMPHLLIAGATGTGKTVCLNSIIVCFLMTATPSEVRLLLIDPKRVEMMSYKDVPHLMTPVVVDTDKVVEVLRRVTHEMDNRYRKLAAVAARNIEGYNQKAAEPLPYLVVVIDELADLMMTASDVIEPLICRLAQLSRATGIHLVVATQRPSVDVVTGLIKANFPSRISFAVTSAVDSRTILDATGAEVLLGRGDMLFLPSDAPKPKRLRGCFVSDHEIERVVEFWRAWSEGKAVDYIAREFTSLEVTPIAEEPLLDKARELAQEYKHLSTSLLQRHLRIGYPRAARIMDMLEAESFTAPAKPENSEDADRGHPLP